MSGRRDPIDTVCVPARGVPARRVTGSTAPMRRLSPSVALIPAIAFALALAACARSGPPAPVVYGGGADPAQSGERGGSSGATERKRPSEGRQVDRSGRSSAPDQARRRGGDQASDQAAHQPTTGDVNWARTGRAGLHTVAKGDSVYGLARRYQVPIRAIIDANDLQPPYTLYVGQEIRIPVPRRHVVERGDTVYGISRAYDVDMSQLTRLNDIEPPYEIAPGQVLVIPGRGREAAPTRTARSGDGATSSDGDSRQASASARQDPRDEEAGTAVASLPDAPAGTPAPPQPPSRKTAGTGATQTATPAQDAAREADAQPAAAPQPKSVPRPPPRAEARFLWPVRGKVLSGFGPMEGGLHNDGINIAAPAGTPVKSAENGVVAYVGNELRGFGNLLLIKHADGWVTAYAHTQEVLVSHGQKIKRGQIVARVGATGSVSQPQLHFEVRKRSKAKDPDKLLGSQQAAR